MAIRFSSFEFYKGILAQEATGKPNTGGVFLSGLGAGITEAVAVVTPMEVVKIRLQAQHHSMSDPLDVPRYRNAAHAAYTVVKEEGFGALYRGVGLTAVRQGTNQAVNFTAYQAFKKWAKDYQPQYANAELPSWQHLLLGGLSGAMGPMSNAPIDTIKTRIQRAPNPTGERGFTRFLHVTKDLVAHEVLCHILCLTIGRPCILQRFDASSNACRTRTSRHVHGTVPSISFANIRCMRKSKI
jgi:solute carrier family 25 (mitochondrial citrate transporter), member 1